VFVHAKPAGGVGEESGLGEGAWLELGEEDSLGLGFGDAIGLGDGVDAGLGEGFEPVADPHSVSNAIKLSAVNNRRMPRC
jgi:hypothetical protein